MKKGILFFLTILPMLALAQKSELGLSGGIAFNAAPSGSIYFKATEGGTSPAASLTYLWNVDRYSERKIKWQVGLGLYNYFGLNNESGQTYLYFADTIGNDGKKFRYARYAYAVGPVVNLKYELSKVNYVYGGVSLGLTGSRNTSNRNNLDHAGKDYTYTAPDGGVGFYGRLHAGITQRLSQRFAINGEVGYSYYNLNFKVDDLTYPGGTSFSYNTRLISAMVGIRYRMGWLKEVDRGTGRMRIIKEEIETEED